jgi:predicted TIM-barrel enzyme
VYPVVHVFSPNQAAEQTRLALKAGADGVYLIDHEGSSDDLLYAYRVTRDAVGPLAFVGVNLLECHDGLDAFRTIVTALWKGAIDEVPNGLWVDDALPEAASVAELRQEVPELATIRYLGGTSFKYTLSYRDDPALSAAEARVMAPFVDVVCTSGPGTGIAPLPEKITAMKGAIGDQPLAVASGVDHRNLGIYRDAVDEVLVSTSIETEPGSGVFNPDELYRLVATCHGH